MTDPNTYDWSRFSVTFYYNAHITRVFRLWTEAEGLESFLSNDVFIPTVEAKRATTTSS